MATRKTASAQRRPPRVGTSAYAITAADLEHPGLDAHGRAHLAALAACKWATPPAGARASVGARHVHMGHVDAHPTEGPLAAVYHPVCAGCGAVLDGCTITLGLARPDHDSRLDGHLCLDCEAGARAAAAVVDAGETAAARAADVARRARNRALTGVEEPTLDDLLAALAAAKKS